MGNSKKKEYFIHKTWSNWIIWQCFVPLGVIFIIWLISGLVARIDHPFLRTFSDGDLLIFSALLLLGVSVELSKFQISEESVRWDRSLELKSGLSKAFAVFILILFGAIKVDMMKENYFDSNPLASSLSDYCIISCLVLIGAVGFSANAFWETTQQILKEREN